jgi:Mce-associated membrane protein
MTVLEKPRTQQQDPDPAPSRRFEITPVRALAALVALAALAALFFGGRWALALGDDGL